MGVDIPAGEYIVLNTGSRRNGYFSVTSDANGDDILFNDNFQYNSIITISDGEYLELSASTAYPFDEWCSQNTIDTTQYGCMLKVGVNIPAGEYKIEATGDHGIIVSIQIVASKILFQMIILRVNHTLVFQMGNI